MGLKLRQLKKIIVHCSDSKTGNAAKIKKWHVVDKGWNDIGYHYVINRNGEIETGRPIERIGAHCKGKNRYSVGICLIGKPTNESGIAAFKGEQIDSLRVLCHTLIIKEGLELESVFGHNTYTDKKICPGFDVEIWWKLAKGDLDGVEV